MVSVGSKINTSGLFEERIALTDCTIGGKFPELSNYTCKTNLASTKKKLIFSTKRPINQLNVPI